MSVGPARCVTCSDEAVIAAGAQTERVAIDLVPDARPGDLLLCHAGIALARLEDAS